MANAKARSPAKQPAKATKKSAAKKTSRPKAAAKANTTMAVVLPNRSAPLSKEDKLRLAEAVRLGEDARKRAESALAEYGQWLLVHIFGDDTTEALQHKRANPVWQELLALAGGPKLRLSRTSLHLAVGVAAYDKRLNDEAFRALDVTRKRILLPLDADHRIREAAQHISAMKMSATIAQEYVRAIMESDGERPIIRMTPAAAGQRVERAARLFSDKTTLGKWKSQLGDLTGERRTEALTNLEGIAKAVNELMETLRKEQ